MINDRETNILPEEIKRDTFEVPYDVRDEVLWDFIKALSLQIKLAKSGEKKYFEMHPRTRKGTSSIVLNKKHIKVNKDGSISCFSRKWGKGSIRCSSEKLPAIKNDIRLLYNNGHFYMVIPSYKDIEVNYSKKVAGVDPGERIFQTVFDTNNQAYLIGGEGDSDLIDKKSLQASRLRNGIKTPWVGGKRIEEKVIKNGNEKTVRRWVGGKKVIEKVLKKKRKGLRKVASKIEKKIKNKIIDIHRKTAKFLCKEYNTVIIPRFRSSEMVVKKNKRGNWRNIGKNTSRRLLRWTHFKFLELLKAKGEVFGTNIIIGTEEWTSKTCTNCLKINHNLNMNTETRIIRCSGCGIGIHRDLNGARNILIKNWFRTSLELNKV